MNPQTRARLFGFEHAFDHPVTVVLVAAIAVALLLAWVVIRVLGQRGRIDAALQEELVRRHRSWLVLVPLLVIPILAGAFWTILGVGILSLACYREYARATGLFREKLTSLAVTAGILAVTFAVLDHWYQLFVALFPLTVAAICAAAILPDQPKGYIQRVGLAVLGFMFFGVSFGHLGYIANDGNYRPILLTILLAVEANDIFAYLVGKTLGQRQLAPQASPNKTIAGAIGAVVLTTALVLASGHFVFQGTPVDSLLLLLILGVLISVAGQIGDLMLSSIKRDLGLKDFGVLLPGHGGLLDRFDSLILVGPVVFHYVNYFVGFGLDQPTRILTGR